MTRRGGGERAPGGRARCAGATLLLAVLALAAPAARAAGDAGLAPCTASWQRVLSRHAVDGGVDYRALQAGTADLEAFLGCVATTRPATLAPSDRLAFLVNAYNALVVAQVLEHYPGLRSVRDVEGFFDAVAHPVGGRSMTLDALEAAARELDPRVHFAVVCASRSCPDLRREAYRGDRVERQLGDQTRRFLADREKGLRFDREAGVLHLSSIFKWYAGDFTGGSTVVAFFARGGVLDWVTGHLGDRRLAAELARARPAVRYLDYDWSLNDR